MNKKTVINLIISTLSLVVLFSNVVIPGIKLFTDGSRYMSDIGYIHCEDEWSCRHEVGHLMDDELGYPSKSKEFGSALLIYVYYQIKYDELNKITNSILGTPGIIYYSESFEPGNFEEGSSPQQELYANLYAEVFGDVSKLPPSLQQFYSNDRKYEEIYQNLIKNKYYFSN